MAKLSACMHLLLVDNQVAYYGIIHVAFHDSNILTNTRKVLKYTRKQKVVPFTYLSYSTCHAYNKAQN